MATIRALDTSLAGSDLRELSFRLLNTPLYVPDVLRDTKRIMETATKVFSTCLQPFALVDKANKLGGAFFVSDIIPEHEATFYQWVWGDVITPTTLPFMRGYIEECAGEYGLARVVARTPCVKCGHLLEHLGFKMEGRFARGYKSGGRLHTLYQFRNLMGR